MPIEAPNPNVVRRDVQRALDEDIGSGDATADLLPADAVATARVITREDAVIAGSAWFDACFDLLDPSVNVKWECRDGDRVAANDLLCTLKGPARALVSGERCALNFLQALSGTATTTAKYVDAVRGTQRDDPRHAQDIAGPAHRAEIRRALRRRQQSSHRTVRRDADQGKPHRRGGLARRRGARRARASSGFAARSGSRELRRVARSARRRRRSRDARRVFARRHSHARSPKWTEKRGSKFPAA